MMLAENSGGAPMAKRKHAEDAGPHKEVFDELANWGREQPKRDHVLEPRPPIAFRTDSVLVAPCAERACFLHVFDEVRPPDSSEPRVPRRSEYPNRKPEHLGVTFVALRGVG